jgi:hypothetical protein
MVLTPVGYKCPEHARAKKGQYTFVKPKQLMRAWAAGVAVGIGGAVVLMMSPIQSFWLGILWGALTAGAVRRASGGHLGKEVGTVAGVCLAIGGVLGFFVGLSPLTTGVAILVALVQLAVIGSR